MPFFAILTLFPEALEPYVATGMLRVAQEKGLARIQLIDFRDFTRDRHRTVDDRPFGGGPGMLLKPEPIAECIEWLERRHGRFHKIALCPSGRPFAQPRAAELAREERVLLLCGRYEGFDTRLLEQFGFEELSVGDFVLAGGELPALCVLEAAVRLLPGVLGDERLALEDSFGPSGVLDHLGTTPARASSAARRCRRCCSRTTTRASRAGAKRVRARAPPSAGRTSSNRVARKRRTAAPPIQPNTDDPPRIASPRKAGPKPANEPCT